MAFDTQVATQGTAQPGERADLGTPLDTAPGPDGAATARASAPEGAGSPPRPATAPIWLQRLSLFVLVLFCVYLGVLVMVLPWWTRVWDDNLWIQSRPALASILRLGAVRGVISGLGLLDIWIGISEAVHYHDHRG